MSLIKKPSELEVNTALVAMVYGQPGAGKTSLACSAPKPVLFDFDNGVNRMYAGHKVPTVQVRSWEDVVTALDEVKGAGEYKTIVIDTAGKMLACMEEYIKRTQPKYKKADGALSLQGYGLRKQMFIRFNNDLRMTGLNVIYVAHEIEQKRGDETIVRPEVGGSSSSDLIKELDLVGYCQMYGTQRTVTFDPSDRFYAKNTCGLSGTQYVPDLFPTDKAWPENDYFTTVIRAYHQRLDEGRKLSARYETLCDQIRSNAAEIANADDANNFVKWVTGLEHVFNSKSVALQALNAKVAELGLKYDKTTKTYSDGTSA